MNKDFQVIEEMKAALAKWSWHPEVRAALSEALADNNVSPDELARIRASIGIAMAEKLGGMEAFRKLCRNEELLEEVEKMASELGGNPLMAKELEIALKDGQISQDEIARLRAIAREVRTTEMACPGFKLPYPELEPSWRTRKKDEDRED